MKPLNRKLWRDLSSLKLQVLSMALLIACGSSILIASWSAYLSLYKAKESYYQNYQFADIFVNVVRAPFSLLEKVRDIPGIERAESRILSDALIDIPEQDEPALGQVLSISAETRINKLHLRSGRMPMPSTVREILVHESFANAHHLQPGDRFSVTLKSQKIPVVVSGIAISPEYIYALSAFAPFPDDLHFGVLWMLQSDLEDLLGLQGAFNNIVVKAKDEKLLPAIKQSIDHLVEPFGSVGAYDRSMQISNIFIQDEIRQQKSMSYVVPAIFILVAIFILHTVLHRLIQMHRAQIATLKSLGYRSFMISVHYWKFVSVILILGLIPGVVFAHGIGQWYTILYRQFYRFPSIEFNISASALAIGFLVCLIPGWIITFVTLRTIFKMHPAEAMRPSIGTELSLAHTNLWNKIYGGSTKVTMIYRNIFFRPFRTLLSILGLSAAIGILINGSFWSDVVDYVVNIQFREANREDIEIQFRTPRKEDIASELYNIQGVQLVETARTVGINLIVRKVKKSTAIIGTENSQMRRLLNSQDHIQRWDETTVLLSRYFQNEYHLQVGEKVGIELSDKTHSPFTVVIGGFVDDLVGSAIYAKKSELHKWLSEEPCANSAYLRIDSSQAKGIYRFLKQSPEVIAVQNKQLLFQGFNKILSKMIKTFTAILLGFAISITVIVLFNTSRISLSERSWEFASMRIMGFHNAEIFHLLYAEIGILVICALLPGFALGYFLSFLSTRLIHSETLSFPLIVNPETYATATIILIASYFIIGFFVYRSIKSISLTEALKARG